MPTAAPLPLLDRDPSPEDAEAARDAPRPGVWAGEPGADVRALTQAETDGLIRYELCRDAAPADRAGVVAACGGPPDRLPLDVERAGAGRIVLAASQRGGLDSDPLVRVLARRVWGDRDRQWFALRSARARDATRVLQTRHAWRLRR